MSSNRIVMPRRRFVGGLAASAALAATAPFGGASAQTYPNRRFSVIIPTGQGGGAERIARPFDAAWGPMLKRRSSNTPSIPAPPVRSATSSSSSAGRATGTISCSATWAREMLMYATAEARLQFPARLHLFLAGRDRRQLHLRQPQLAVQDHPGRGRGGEEADAQRRGEPASDADLDRRAGARRSHRLRASTSSPMAAATRPTSPCSTARSTSAPARWSA